MTLLNKDKKVKVSWIDIISSPDWTSSEKGKRQT